jgi:hypothetical protein
MVFVIILYYLKENINVKKIFLGIIVLAITGCANTSSQSANSLAKSTPDANAEQKTAEQKTAEQLLADHKIAVGYRCEKIVPVGSRIGKKVCTTKAQREEMRKAAQLNISNGKHSSGR